jgi:hypothetical protein
MQKRIQPNFWLDAICYSDQALALGRLYKIRSATLRDLANPGDGVVLVRTYCLGRSPFAVC